MAAVLSTAIDGALSLSKGCPPTTLCPFTALNLIGSFTGPEQIAKWTVFPTVVSTAIYCAFCSPTYQCSAVVPFVGDGFLPIRRLRIPAIPFGF